MAVAVPLVLGGLGALGTAGIPLGGFAFASAVGTGLSALGTVAGVVSAVSAVGGLIGGQKANTAAVDANLSAANANAQINNANASIADQNAQQAATAAQTQADADRLASQRRIATIQGSFAKGGVISNTGTGLLDVLDQAGQGEYQAQEDLYAGKLQSNADTDQANIYRSKAAYNGIQAQQAITTGDINGTTSLLNGVSKIASSTTGLSNLQVL